MPIDETRLKNVMAAVLQVDPASITEASSVDTLPTWDSIHHIDLIVALEQEFGVSLPDEVVADLSSYKLLALALAEAPAKA